LPFANTKPPTLSELEAALASISTEPAAPNVVSTKPDAVYFTIFALGGFELVRPPTYKAPVASVAMAPEVTVNSPPVPNEVSIAPVALTLMIP
jgi:hypothetical protein